MAVYVNEARRGDNGADQKSLPSLLDGSSRISVLKLRHRSNLAHSDTHRLGSGGAGGCWPARRQAAGGWPWKTSAQCKSPQRRGHRECARVQMPHAPPLSRGRAGRILDGPKGHTSRSASRSAASHLGDVTDGSASMITRSSSHVSTCSAAPAAPRARSALLPGLEEGRGGLGWAKCGQETRGQVIFRGWSDYRIWGAARPSLPNFDRCWAPPWVTI